MNFPELFELHSAYVWSTLRRLGVRSSDLEDLTHDVFVHVFRKLEDYDPSRPIKPWLFGFAFRVASDYRRRRQKTESVVSEPVDVPDRGHDPVEQLLSRERRELALAVLDTLELDRRAVFVLHEVDGCAMPEIAAVMGVPLATCYSRLRLAREDFATALRRLRCRQR